MNIEKMLINNSRKAMLDNINALDKKTLQRELESHLKLEFKYKDEVDRLNNIINELEKYIHNELILDFYNDDMPCELIINKMEKMIKELKEDK